MSTNFKLVSRKGTFLGTLTVPDNVAQLLERQYHAVTHALPHSPQIPIAPGVAPLDTIELKTLVLHRSHALPDAVELDGNMTLEEIEKLKGFTFAPGAAYLRSMIHAYPVDAQGD